MSLGPELSRTLEVTQNSALGSPRAVSRLAVGAGAREREGHSHMGVKVEPTPGSGEVM